MNSKGNTYIWTCILVLLCAMLTSFLISVGLVYNDVLEMKTTLKKIEEDVLVAYEVENFQAMKKGTEVLVYSSFEQELEKIRLQMMSAAVLKNIQIEDITLELKEEDGFYLHATIQYKIPFSALGRKVTDIHRVTSLDTLCGFKWEE